MGLYLGSTKIPTISFYKSGAIMPSGVFNIPSEPTISTRCYVNLTTLESYREYFRYNGTTYRNGGSSFEFTAGDILSIEVYGEYSGADIYEDGQKIGTCDANNPYSYILPSHELTINTVTAGGGATVYINSVLTSTYDVTSYAFANGDFGYGRLAERISGDISGYSNSTATAIASFAFAGLNISSISMPAVKSIYSYAFTGCTNLTSVDFPSCTSIGASAFANCSNLTYISFPACTFINGGAFVSCSNLISANFPMCTTVNNGAFSYCRTLSTASLPLILSATQYLFYGCYNLTSVNFLSCMNIQYGALQNCSSLSLISLPNCSGISTYAFSGCYNLLSVYLMSTSVVSLANIAAFNSTPISNYTTSTGGVYGSIYVPSSLLASYKAATNWATYSNRIVGV